MDDLDDAVGRRAGVVQQLEHALDDAARVVVGRRQHFLRPQRPVGAEQHDVRERPADVDADAGPEPLDDRREPAVDEEHLAVDEVGGGEARKTTAPPSSSGSPQRPAGTRLRSQASNPASAWSGPVRSVRNYPGAIPFAWIPCGAHSAHIVRVSIFSAPFVAA